MRAVLLLLSVVGYSQCADLRSKRQFFEVAPISGLARKLEPTIVYRYTGDGRWSPAADPYFSGVIRPVVSIQPATIQLPKVERIEYVPVRRVYRPKTIVVERPATMVIERPAQVLASVPSSAYYIELLKKKRRMMAAKQ